MFCKQCGRPLPDNARFCMYCQAPTGIQPPQQPVRQQMPNRPLQQQQTPRQPSPPPLPKTMAQKKTAPKRKKRFPLVLIIALVLIVLIVVVFFGIRYALEQLVPAPSESEPATNPPNTTTEATTVPLTTAAPTTLATEPTEDETLSTEPPAEGTTEPVPTSPVSASNRYYSCYLEGRSFILDDSDWRTYTRAQLSGLTTEELIIARNEIFARHGYIFTDPDLLEYFSAMEWYIPRIPADRFTEDLLNSTERSNIATLRACQDDPNGTDPITIPDDGSNLYLHYYDPDTEFILPDSDRRIYTEAELQHLTAEELILARNEIYARHGYVFRSGDLAEYFSYCSWYHPAGEYFPPEELNFNEYEGYNVNLILTVEAQSE